MNVWCLLSCGIVDIFLHAASFCIIFPLHIYLSVDNVYFSCRRCNHNYSVIKMIINDIKHNTIQNLLTVQSVKTQTYGNRAFSASAPVLWNSLPTEIRKIPSFALFKTVLKTHLFSQMYNASRIFLCYFKIYFKYTCKKCISWFP